MTRGELSQLIQGGETLNLEFKRDDIYPDQLAKELSALLNTDGGHILLGVEDDGTLRGISKPDLEQWVMNVYRNSMQPPVNLPFEMVRIDETRKIGVVTVPSKSPDNPYRAKQGGSWVIFVRVGTTSRQATREEEEYLYRYHALPVIPTGEPRASSHREEFPNPYDFARPATIFFRGRYQELQDLATVLQKGGSAVVFGLQRIGKTSLVEKLLTETIYKRSLPRRILPLRIDMFSAWESFETDLHFLFAIVDELLVQVGGEPEKAKAALRELVYHSSSDIERRRKFREVLQRTSRDARSGLLLFIDEFHDVQRVFERARQRRTTNPVDAGLFRWIGSLIKDGTLQLLISCRYKALPMERSERLELFKLLEEVNLGLLDEASAQALIQDPVAGVVRYDGQAVRRILQLTGRYPYLIQYFCSEVIKTPRVRRCRGVRAKDVEDCAEVLTTDPVREPKFNVLYEDFQEMEGGLPWKALLALAACAGNAEKLVGKNEVVTVVRDHFGRAHSEQKIGHALDRLVTAQVVGEMRRGVTPSYQIQPDLLRRWLRNRRYIEKET